MDKDRKTDKQQYKEGIRGGGGGGVFGFSEEIKSQLASVRLIYYLQTWHARPDNVIFSLRFSEY